MTDELPDFRHSIKCACGGKLTLGGSGKWDIWACKSCKIEKHNDIVSCPFCKRIENREYGPNDQYTVCFPPLNPVTEGHYLVVPRKHIRNALEAPGHAGQTMFFAAQIASQLEKSLGRQMNFITSVGPDATQTIQHLHIHIVPRRPGDGLHLPWTGQVKPVSTGLWEPNR